MDCKDCKSKAQDAAPVPYIAHEAAMARNERNIKRLAIALVAAVLAALISNGAWLYCLMQYDYIGESVSTEISQDGNGLNIVGDRNLVDYDGTESSDYTDN